MSESEQDLQHSNSSLPTTSKSSSFPNNAPTTHKRSHRRQESIYTITTAPASVINKSHNRNPSGSLGNEANIQFGPEKAAKEKECGILTCRPTCMQSCARIKCFVIIISFLLILQQALSYGYINSVITTIEKRFEIPSRLSGVIASSNDIGNVMAVIFVSYLGSQRHIPVWIGVGSLIMGAGSLLFTVPHFMSNERVNNTYNNTTRDICHLSSQKEQFMKSKGVTSCTEDSLFVIRSVNGPVLLFVLAQLFLGSGGSPLFTIGVTYVDDHVKPENSPIYIGLLYSIAALGPILGFLSGAYFLTLHMDFFTKIVVIDSTDNRWVGMWWGGFLLGGIFLILISIPLFSFPKVLTYEREKIDLESDKADTTDENQAKHKTFPDVSASGSVVPAVGAKPLKDGNKNTVYGKNIKDIPHSIWRLVLNPVYIVTCSGACMELIIVSGFLVFLPKYLETQFSFTKSQASILAGSVAIPGASLGIFVGGYILKRLALKPKGAVQLVLISDATCLISCCMLLFLGCDNLKMAGTTVPYLNQSIQEPFTVNLTSLCNFACKCSINEIQPVCGRNGLTYFSPCHAGCTSVSRSNYTNCLCIHAETEFVGDQVIAVATEGSCFTECSNIYPFLILLFFITFIAGVSQMPILMIILRSVREEERSFALGMQFVIFRIFGYIPAPIMFGNLIDSTCLLWKSSCGSRGRCLLYDNEKFRYRFGGLCVGIKIAALFIFLTDWWLVKRQKCSHGDRMLSLHEGMVSGSKRSKSVGKLPHEVES